MRRVSSSMWYCLRVMMERRSMIMPGVSVCRVQPGGGGGARLVINSSICSM